MRKKITGPFKWEQRGAGWQRYFDSSNGRMFACRQVSPGQKRWFWSYTRINSKGHLFHFADGLANSRKHCERIGNMLAKVVT